jgi:murein DD-endopeptidase MepM/ murein hydrolase activator NlpD
MRQHPIFGNWREHKGVDYAAPHGTAVRATSDGIVDFVGKQSGYGNLSYCVMAKPTRQPTDTSAISLGPTDRKSRPPGETIGYVGSTGWATGPHLHYEFRMNNVPQDPLTVRLPDAQPLSGTHYSTFASKSPT